MLSKTERNYLSGRIQPSKNYEHKILHSIRHKLQKFEQEELPLIESKRKVIGNVVAYLGKLTSCQAGLTPRRSGFAN